jgi:hypothetical protein
MGDRVIFHNVLVDLLGSYNVYFQPPAGFQMTYPCIVYSRDPFETEHANNKPYSIKTKYSVTAIVSDPDSDIPITLARLETAKAVTNFKKDQLNHYVYTIFA